IVYDGNQWLVLATLFADTDQFAEQTFEFTSIKLRVGIVVIQPLQQTALAFICQAHEPVMSIYTDSYLPLWGTIGIKYCEIEAHNSALREFFRESHLCSLDTSPALPKRNR